MGEPVVEAIDVQEEVVKPQGIKCDEYDRMYTPTDHLLSRLVLHVDYLAAQDPDSAVVAQRSITIHDGAIGDAMKIDYQEKRDPVYNAASEAAYQPAYDAAIADSKSAQEATEIAEAAARDAGNQAVIDAGIVLGDAKAAWQLCKDKVAAHESGQQLVKLLNSKGWGELILRRAWKKTAV
jgi:hypothetical protein